MQGEASYLRSLVHLQRAVSKDQSAKRADTLASACILSLYELTDQYSVPQRNGFGSHMAGLSTLLLLRGPNGVRDAMSLALFEHSRYVYVLQSILKRKASVFSTSEWMTIPWSAAAKTGEQQILDQGLLLGCLLERSEAFLAHEPGLVSDYEAFDLVQDCMKVHECIGKLLCHRKSPSPSDDASIAGATHPTVAVVRTTSFALQLMACATASDVLSRPAGRTLPHAGINQYLGQSTLIRKECGRLARTILTETKAFLSTDRQSVVGAGRMIFPLRLALQELTTITYTESNIYDPLWHSDLEEVRSLLADLQGANPASSMFMTKNTVEAKFEQQQQAVTRNDSNNDTPTRGGHDSDSGESWRISQTIRQKAGLAMEAIAAA